MSSTMSDANELRKSSSSSGFRPAQPIQIGPPFQWPPKPLALVKWLFGFPGYLWPWSAFYVGLALVWWLYLRPDLDQMKNLSAGWIASLFVENLALLVLFAGAWHLRFYIQKAQGTDYKYNSRWLSADSPTFLFKDQLWDNVFWNVCSAVPIWTAYEASTFWLQANGLALTISWQTHPVYCALLVLLIPMWLAIHFYTTHRVIHWPPLYRWVHYLHHKNVNFGPWSGLAMHPIEHLIYFSAVVLFWFIPSHPLHTVYLLLLAAIGPSLGHLGFDRLVLSKNICVNTGDYMHYLHHKYFNVNFGTGLVPLDKWLGTFHDGSDQATEAMRGRMRSRISEKRVNPFP